jgi:tetratricopeptide (TPR) repeat protein
MQAVWLVGLTLAGVAGPGGPRAWSQDDFNFGDAPFGDAEPQTPLDPGAQTAPAPPEFTPRNDIERASQVTSAEGLALYNEGLALIERQDTIGAITKLQQAAETDPRFAAAHFELAKLYAAMKDYGNAQGQFDIVRQLVTVPVASLYAAQGDMELQLKNYAQAAETLAVASNLDYLNSDLAARAGEARLLEALNARGRAGVQQAADAAMSYFERALQIQPDNARALQLRGRGHLVKARNNDELALEKGLADLTRAVELDPQNLQAGAQLGQTLYGRALTESSRHLGDTSKLKEDLKRAVPLLEQFAQQQLESTTSQERKEQRLEMAPDELSAYQALATAGAALIKLGIEANGPERQELLLRGAEFCRQSIVEEPRLADGYFQLGLSYRMLNDFPRAIEAFSNAIGIDPNNSESYLRRGICYVHTGALEQARSDLQRALEFLPDARAAFWLGVVEAQLGQHAEAVRLYSVALELTRFNYPMASLNRGLSYLQLGDYERAQRDFGETLSRDPDNRRARELRDALRQRLRS